MHSTPKRVELQTRPNGHHAVPIHPIMFFDNPLQLVFGDESWFCVKERRREEESRETQNRLPD